MSKNGNRAEQAPIAFQVDAQARSRRLALELASLWKSKRRDILRIGVLCKQLQELSKHDRVQIKKSLGIGKSTFSKLVRIGRDERLQVEEIRQRLPHDYPTLYLITHLSDYQLMSALVDGVITAELSWRRLQCWLNADATLKAYILSRLVLVPRRENSSPGKAIAEAAVTHPDLAQNFRLWFKNRNLAFRHLRNPNFALGVV